VKFFGRKLNQVSLSPPWKTGFNYFSAQGQMLRWGCINDIQKLRYLHGKEITQMPPKFKVPKEFKDDIKQLTHILINVYGPTTANSPNILENVKLSHAIFQYLDFIEKTYQLQVTREISGEMIKRLGMNFEKIKELVLAFSKSLESFAVISSYSKFFSDHLDEEPYKDNPTDIIAILDHYGESSHLEFQHFQGVYERFYKNNELPLHWLKYQDPEIFYMSKEGGESLKESIESCKASIIHRMSNYLKDEALQKTETRNPMIMDFAMRNVIVGVFVLLFSSYFFFRWNH
jgi:hypothetical protein